MKAEFKRQLRAGVYNLTEVLLGVKVYRNPLFGSDIFDAVQKLRVWSANDIIFDVGANDGRSVMSLVKYFLGSSIYAFEPVSSTFQKLSANTAHLDNVKCYSHAMGAEYEKKTIYLHEKPIMNSFSPEWSDFVGEETVTIDTLDRVMEKHGIDFLHFLKIDTEGYEMEVLMGAEKALGSAKIGIIQVEAGVDQAISPHTSFEQLRSYLASMGYYPHGIFNQKRRRLSTPENWEGKKANACHPSAIKYFDVLFICGSLKGISNGA